MSEQAKPNDQKKIRTWITVFVFLFFGIFLIANSVKINDWLSEVLLFLRPVLLGLTLAYVSNPIFRFFERKVLFRLNPPALRRWLSIFLTYLVFLLAIVLLLLSILPQLVQSVGSFLDHYDSYFSSAVNNANLFIDRLNELFGNIKKFDRLDEVKLQTELSDILMSYLTKLKGFLANVSLKPLGEVIHNVFAWGADVFFAVLISSYLLSTKEKRYAQVMKLRQAFFSSKTNAALTRIFTVADKSFGGFLEGKIVDSLIIGVLTYVAVSIFKIPYAIMIAVFVGVTNIIPVVGPFIGAIPTGVIILLTEPSKVIPFLIIIFVIQQIDGNIIGPKILGDNTGVSSLCVIIAITVMGSLWGFVGMLVGVPLFATILEISESIFKSKLQKKGLPSALESYYSPDAVINPSKMGNEGSDKLVQRLERSCFRIQKRLSDDSSAKPTRKERITLNLYRLGSKFHLFTPANEEQIIRYSAEYAANEAIREERIWAESAFSAAPPVTNREEGV